MRAGQRQFLGRGQQVGHHDGGDPRRRRRADAGMAVLHRDAMRRVDAQAAGGKQVGFGIGLWPFHIAARHDDIEIMDQAAAFQPLLREGRGGGRGERHRDAGARQMIEQQVRARTKRNAGILRRLRNRPLMPKQRCTLKSFS